ncbi:radical SAM protein [Paenibacillus humicus]|uniref:radical SAM protein n=1 Tax=Paenibacillus humicus TaxID=412861 RepID=UPI000FD87471|nr:radical SAM protein [Paenibacillus humicus]
MNRLSRRLQKMIQVGYWPGFIIGMYPSHFAYKPIEVDFRRTWQHVKELNLYAHIPFCKWSCSFCTFFKVVKDDEEYYRRYMQRLNEEFIFYNTFFEEKVNIKSICFGGGTPNTVSVSDYEKFFDTLVKSNVSLDKDLEPSMEISPEIITKEYISDLSKIGIKRLSLGVQSLKGELRKGVNRDETLDILGVIQSIRDNGLNVNIDLINGIIGQDNDSFMETLKEVVAFGPETISIYPLSGKKSSMFKTSSAIMTTKEKYQLYELYYDYLIHNGYDCESHVKFIKKNQNSTHQQKIYEYLGTETLGIGSGSRSYSNLIHYGTSSWEDAKLVKKAIEDYMTKDFRELSWYGFEMNEEENKRRTIVYAWFLGVLDTAAYYQRYHSSPYEDFPEEFEALIHNDLVYTEGDKMHLTTKGRKYTDLAGTIFWSKGIHEMFETVHYA